MNANAFLRILWKEYRTQRTGWTAVAIAIVLFSVALLADPWITPDERTATVFSAALVLAALYALVSSVTLFATERENGTYDFLRAVPVGPWTVFFGKAVFAIASAASMFAFAWSLALVLNGGLPEAHQRRLIWTYCGLTAVEFWAWGMLFSLLTRRTVVAAALAGTVTALILSWLWNKDTNPAEAITGRLLIICLVTAADLILANRWLRERRVPASRAVDLAAERSGRASATGLGRVARLVWQDTRQSAVLSAAILAMLLPLAVNVWVEWLTNLSWEHSIRSNVVYPIFIILMLAGGLSPVLLGATVFLGDQTECHFRFLAERGFPPRLVWLSRHIRGVAVLLLGFLFFLPPAISLIATLRPSWHAEMWEMMRVTILENSIWAVPVAYVCGQICSMTFRSGILAAVFGAILTVLLYGWAAVVFMFGMGWWWTVAPLLVAFMAVTWLHAPNWLQERRGRRVWLPPVLVITIPVVAILATIPLVRIYEIPWVEPGLTPSEVKWVVPPEEKKARKVYSQAIEQLRKASLAVNSPGGETARREAVAKAVTLALEASRYPLPGFCPDEAVTGDEYYWEIGLANAILASGVKLQAEGKLDEALDRYLAADHIAHHCRQTWPSAWTAPLDFDLSVCEQITYWAAERGQTSERVLKATRALEAQWRNDPSTCDEVKYWYVNMRRRPSKTTSWQGPDAPYVSFERYATIARWFPWERARAIRALNKLTAAEIAFCRELDAAMAAGAAEPPYPNIDGTRRLSRDTVTYELVSEMLSFYCRSGRPLRYEKYHRACQLILAIEAWRLDHGSLPISLDQLTGKYIERLPVDPYDGRQFGYYPKGLSYRVEWNFIDGAEEYNRVMEPGQPFVGGPVGGLWTGGNSSDMNSYDRERGQPNLWGWVFPIPSSGENQHTVPPPP